MNKVYFVFFFFVERGMEIGVLQDNAELLKSHNVSLHEEAQTLSLQITVCPAGHIVLSLRYFTGNL